MSDHKQTIDICNISPSYHQPSSHEGQGQQRSSKWDGDPKNNNPTQRTPSSLLKHNHTIKALLPFPHCLISAGYLWYLCGCFLSLTFSLLLCPPPMPHTHTHTHTDARTPALTRQPTCLLPPPLPRRSATFRGVSLLPWPIWRSPHVECAYAESAWIDAVWGEVKYLQKYDLTRFIKWGKMKTKQLLVLS